ncbi:MAG: hypothetical protein WAM92_15905 [Mycobacterium sp.]
MPYVASFGTYLPCWGTANHRVPGDDEDAMAEAGKRGPLVAVEQASLSGLHRGRLRT